MRMVVRAALELGHALGVAASTCLRLLSPDVIDVGWDIVVQRVGELGAAGAVEAIFSILAIRDNVAPPTLNLDNPSVETQIDLVPKVAKLKTLRHVLSNSFGFGGVNASLVFSAI